MKVKEFEELFLEHVLRDGDNDHPLLEAFHRIRKVAKNRTSEYGAISRSFDGETAEIVEWQWVLGGHDPQDLALGKGNFIAWQTFAEHEVTVWFKPNLRSPELDSVSLGNDRSGTFYRVLVEKFLSRNIPFTGGEGIVWENDYILLGDTAERNIVLPETLMSLV